MSANNPYPLEDIRTFLTRRQWFVGDASNALLSQEQYEQLKARILRLEPRMAYYLRAFMDGWLRAKS